MKLGVLDIAEETGLTPVEVCEAIANLLGVPEDDPWREINRQEFS